MAKCCRFLDRHDFFSGAAFSICCSWRALRSWLDTISATQRYCRNRARPSMGHRSLADQHWIVLSVVIDERDQFRCNYNPASRTGHDVDAPAVDLLDMVRYGDPDSSGIQHFASGAGDADAGPPC